MRLTCRRGKRDQGERLGPAFGHELNRLLGGFRLGFDCSWVSFCKLILQDFPGLIPVVDGFQNM